MKTKISLIILATSLIIASCDSSSDKPNVQSNTEPYVQEKVKTPEEIKAEEKLAAEQKIQEEKLEAERKKQEAIDDKIREKLKAQARRDWPDDYSTQEYWVTQEMEDYEYMKTISDDDRIKKKAQQNWPLDFSTQKYWYNEQIEAKERMK